MSISDTGLVGDLDLETALGQGQVDLVQQDVDDRPQLGVPQGVEDDHLVHPVHELGAEVVAQLPQDLLLETLEGALLVGLGKAHAATAQHQLAADVRGHQHERVLEVHPVAVGVGQRTVFEDLQQQVGDVVMSLLDLVEEHHRIGLPADALGQLAALVVADVARRRADHLRHGVLFHVLAHVEAHEGVLAAEQELSQTPRHLGLADPRGAEEDERADGPLRVADPQPGAADRPADGVDGVVLAHHPAAQGLLHAGQLLRLVAL
jgi:hypothetical protein